MGTLYDMLAEPPREEDLGTCAHTGAVRELPELIKELVRLAVLADRQASSTWAQIGEVLGISPDVARSRYRVSPERAAENR